MEKISKETIISQLQETSNKIANGFDGRYFEEITFFAGEMAISYQVLWDIINSENQDKISDADFQSALMFWVSLNTVLSSIELFRRGYPVESQMLLRNTLETFSAAYDIHVHPEKLDNLRRNPKSFDSKQSISVAKNINSFIGQMYGQLSSKFTHVSPLHTLPHKSSTPICIGGLYDPKENKYQLIPLAGIMLTLDTLNAVLEFTFFDEISDKRFWARGKSKEERLYKPKPYILERGTKFREKMAQFFTKPDSKNN